MAESYPTRADLFRIGASEVFLRSALRPAGKRLKPEAVFTDGTDANILIAATAAMGDEAIRHLAARTAALYIDSAQGEDLDRLVADRVSPTIVRKQATRSLATLAFVRTDTDPGAVTLPIGTKLATADGTEFTLLQSVSFGLLQSGPITALAQSLRAGRGGNVDANTINVFVTAAPQSDMTVDNQAPASGGQNVETDPELRARTKDFYRTVRRGTLSAIEFGALTVPGISRVSVVEETDSDGFPTGTVNVFIADIEGRANQALADAVQLQLLDFRAAGIVTTIVPGEPSIIDIAYLVQFDSTTDTRAATEKIKTATVASLETLRPGDTLRVSSLFAIARSISGVIVPSNAIQNPVGDLVPENPNQLLRTTIARITVNGV